MFVAPSATGRGWQLTPCLSLDMIRLIAELGGDIDRELRRGYVPGASIADLVEHMNTNVLHSGDRNLIDSRKQLTHLLNGALGLVMPGVTLTDARDRWGRLAIRRERYRADDQAGVDRLRLDVLTFNVRQFKQRLLGSVDTRCSAKGSAVMDLGEAITAAVERGLPILRSTEAAGYLDGQVRVGRMEGKPRMLTITSADGLAATTRRASVRCSSPRAGCCRSGTTSLSSAPPAAGCRRWRPTARSASFRRTARSPGSCASLTARPATEAHRALRQVRLSAAADCWPPRRGASQARRSTCSWAWPSATRR